MPGYQVPQDWEWTNLASGDLNKHILVSLALNCFWLCWGYAATRALLCGERASAVEVCGVLAPQPGMEPRTPALGGCGLNHWTTMEVPHKW